MTTCHLGSLAGLAAALLLTAPMASASPRTPPTLEELVVACDVIVMAKVLEQPRLAGDWYRVESDVILKGHAPGVIRVRAQVPYTGPVRVNAERPAALERGARRLMLFLHADPDEDGYSTDIFRKLPAESLSFGFDRKARNSKNVFDATLALVALNDPALEDHDAVRLWIEGLRSKNDALVASLVERTGRYVSWGKPRERMHRQRKAGSFELAGELRRLLGHGDEEIRANAALYLKGLLDDIADAAATVAARAEAIDALRMRLDDPSSRVRARTLSALAEMGDVAVRPRIIRLLEDRAVPSEEREAAMWSVGYLTKVDPSQKGEDLVDALLTTLDDADLARYAVAVLRRQTGDEQRKTVASWLAFREERQDDR